jgi:transposase
MPWKGSRIVDERIKFIADILRGDHNMTELCQIYNIFRKTGYKWIERFQESGASGLEELDRRPQNCPDATPDRIVKQILELRFRHPTWGAGKLRARLEETKSGTEWPATSTITAILHRSGLLHTAKHKRKVTPSSSPLAVITAPNQVWCMDFKGYFRCGNRQRCDPFTIIDGHSGFIIRCQTVPKMDFEHVDAICEAAMREFGVPDRIRTDNGTPFATMGLLGPSKLSIKWLKLGIVHERITRLSGNVCRAQVATVKTETTIRVIGILALAIGKPFATTRDLTAWNEFCPASDHLLIAVVSWARSRRLGRA